MKSKKYVTLYATRNSGQYKEAGTAGTGGTLGACKRSVRAAAGCRLRWQLEGEDLACYKHAEDMGDDNKAYARIRPMSAS